jgi:hypothetical protein
MDTTAKRSGCPSRGLMSSGFALFGLIAAMVVSGCGGGEGNAGSESGLAMANTPLADAATVETASVRVAWSPDSVYASLAPGESETFQVAFTSAVSATGVTTFVVPEIADHVSLNPSSFASLAAGQTYSIDVTLTSPPGMEVAEKDGVIMLRQGRRALARPLPVNLSFAPKIYTVTATATVGGEISPSSQVVALGDVAELTLRRDSEYGISRVTGCGGTRLGDTYTTAPIVESCAVEAVFGELVFFGSQPINDTGIDWCADAANNYDDGGAAYKRMQCEAVTIAGFPGQDGHFGRDALARAGQLPKIGDGAAGFDYTKISNSGAELPASATLGSSPNDWACTRDNLTWLIWEVKTNDGGLRHRNHTYTWYDPNSPDGIPGTPNGGSCVGSDCDTTGFVEAVNARGLCGARDWRMPTVDELLSINHLGRVNPAIDSTFFPNTPPYWFWSSTPEARYTDTGIAAFPVRFSYGGEGWGLKSYSHRVRLVRSGR